MRETRCHAICLFDYDEEDRRAEHEEATKTPDSFNSSGGFAPKGPNKRAEGQGDASSASVAVALGRSGSSVLILFPWIASALKERNMR
jgi:hypothetical protein